MFSYSTGYYVLPPVDQYLKFKNRCSLVCSESVYVYETEEVHFLSDSLCLKIFKQRISWEWTFKNNYEPRNAFLLARDRDSRVFCLLGN